MFGAEACAACYNFQKDFRELEIAPEALVLMATCLLLEGLQSIGCQGDPHHRVSPLPCDGHVEPGFLFLLSFEDLFFLMHTKHVGVLNAIAPAHSGEF